MQVLFLFNWYSDTRVKAAPDMESDTNHNQGPLGRKRISETFEDG